jgi:hypothetical protein
VSLRGEHLAALDSVGCRKLALETVGLENRAVMLLTFPPRSGVAIPFLAGGQAAPPDRVWDANVGDANRPTELLRAAPGLGDPIARLFPTDWLLGLSNIGWCCCCCLWNRLAGPGDFAVPPRELDATVGDAKRAFMLETLTLSGVSIRGPPPTSLSCVGP